MSEWQSCVHDFGNAPRPPLFRRSPNLCKGANKINKKREGDARRHDLVSITLPQKFLV